MIKLSSGTASVIGLTNIKLKVPPTTAYVMLGESCSNNCKFCTQATTSKSTDGLLSRVDWHQYDEEEVLTLTQDAYIKNKIKRLCFQVIDSSNSFEETITALEKVKRVCNIPVCSSSNVKTLNDASILFDAGLDRLCIALDAATDVIYNQVKGDKSDFSNKLSFLIELSKNFPQKITTHLIVGLGETEMEMANIIWLLTQNNIKTALFAFTPVKGTAMESRPKPNIDKYRRIQIVNYLMQNNFIKSENIISIDGKIIGFDETAFHTNPTLSNSLNSTFSHKLHQTILSCNGECFMTTGCSDCNRPYYNENPGSIPYNYPYRPTKDEIVTCIKQSGLF